MRLTNEDSDLPFGIRKITDTDVYSFCPFNLLTERVVVSVFKYTYDKEVGFAIIYFEQILEKEQCK